MPMSTAVPTRRRAGPTSPPTWIKPQLAKLVEKAPEGFDWLHELKLDGYRMHARLDVGRVQILTRRGNDWTEKYPAIAKALVGLPARNAYLDGELCGLLPDGRTAFNLIQNATDTGEGSLVFFLFDLLFLNGENLMALPVVERKARLASLLKRAPHSLQYNDHQIGHGPEFHRLACQRGLEGIVSKRTNGRYEPDRRTWLKIKCLNREEFVVVGWSDPEGSRHLIGSLLLGYYTPQGKLIYAGRVGTGMPVAELERLWPLRDRQDAARNTTTTRHPLRLTTRALARPLGAARNGRRSELRRVDARWLVEACGLSRGARRQGSHRGASQSTPLRRDLIAVRLIPRSYQTCSHSNRALRLFVSVTPISDRMWPRASEAITRRF
jgi:bifunctional non-homologous end joining protein LigD